jgi:hypothetical protein
MPLFSQSVRFGICRAGYLFMDEKDFKKHLRDLAQGHHHPEEHEWDTNPPKTSESVVTEAGQASKSVVRKRKPQKRTARS